MWIASVCAKLCMVSGNVSDDGVVLCSHESWSLDELVQDGVNGRIFSNGSELAGLFAVRVIGD